ncbi:flagellar assembly protein FliH [Alkalicoccus daliensis]|uniref:flagellar assembly protein FliH n=1 Tax=Alkalicoccus daliensis TaxID=745820 RepID=UPI001586BE6A|nr:flagellar assembly protein FliH [Alkalicoccus daliensis]
MSRLIKSSSINEAADNRKIIKVRSLQQKNSDVKSEAAAADDRVYTDINEEEKRIRELEEKQSLLQEKEAAFAVWKKEQEEFIKSEAENAYHSAAEEGFQKGYQDGIDEAQKQVDEYLRKASEIVDLSQLDYQKRIEEAEPVILELALKISEQIIGESLQSDNKKWVSLVKQAVNEVREQDPIKIYVHPYWYETTLNQQEELKEAAMHAAELTIYPDGQLSENGCVIDTPFGKVEATVDMQLAEIKRFLFEKLKEGESD